MIKVVGFVKRRKDLTREQFKDYWLNNHSKLEKESVETTYTRKIVASFATGEKLREEEPIFDGMVELYFDSIEDMRAQFAGQRREVMRKDEENFVDLSEEPVFVITEEYLIAEKTPRKL